jgi:hypothetical protein
MKVSLIVKVKPLPAWVRTWEFKAIIISMLILGLLALGLILFVDPIPFYPGR